MSPRNKMLRKVLSPPVIKGFRPFGGIAESQTLTPVNLLFEEYEALRLCDYDMYNHHHASEIMGISRPTFTRIYAEARRKIARALVEGCTISIEGGKVYFDSDWYTCSDCHCYFNNPEKDKSVNACPLCGSMNVNAAASDAESIDAHVSHGCHDLCICPQCGFKDAHQSGMPCSNAVCPTCGSHLKRQGSPLSGDGKRRFRKMI